MNDAEERRKTSQAIAAKTELRMANPKTDVKRIYRINLRKSLPKNNTNLKL